MRTQYRFMTFFAGLFLSLSLAAQPIMNDDFSTGDVSKSAGGFEWSGSDSANDPTAATYVAETVTRNGDLGEGLHFFYKAGGKWSEKRFDIGEPHPELWV